MRVVAGSHRRRCECRNVIEIGKGETGLAAAKVLQLHHVMPILVLFQFFRNVGTVLFFTVRTGLFARHDELVVHEKRHFPPARVKALEDGINLGDGDIDRQIVVDLLDRQR